MDKRDRLTKFSEWKKLAFYQWLKGSEWGEKTRCIELDSDKRDVIFMGEDGKIVRQTPKQWRNRWVEVEP